MKLAKKQNSRLRGFTLMEMLAVISILSVLLTTLVPSLLYAVRMAFAADCRTRLHNIYAGAAQWASDHNDLLPVITNGTGENSVLSPYWRYPGQPEVAEFMENYLKSYAEKTGEDGVVKACGSALSNPLRCPLSKDTYGDINRYSSYEFLAFSRSTVGEDLSYKEKTNNGHGNNEDGVDSSNPGESKPGEDTDPNVDDEIKDTDSGGGPGYGVNGENLPIRTYLNNIRPHRVSSAEYSLPSGRVVLVMDRAYADPDDPRNAHETGANVLYGDGQVDFVPRQENAIAEMMSNGEVLTEIGQDGILRPNRSHGWHGGPNDASFFYPGLDSNDSGPGSTNRLMEVGDPGEKTDPNRGTGRGIFF